MEDTDAARQELSQVGRTESFGASLSPGGGVMDARWVERGRPEARGEDVLGGPFTMPDDNIVLVQGRQVVAGSGAGRVGLRVTGRDGVARVDHGLNVGVPRERDAATALPNGVIRIPVGDLREGSIHARPAGDAVAALRVRLALPQTLRHEGPAALLVSRIDPRRPFTGRGAERTRARFHRRSPRASEGPG
jgi:hypothetical protein